MQRLMNVRTHASNFDNGIKGGCMVRHLDARGLVSFAVLFKLFRKVLLLPLVGGNVFEFQMSSNLFPFRDEAKTLKINSVWLLARCTDPGNYTAVLSPPLTVGSDALSLARANQFGGLHLGQKDLTELGVEIPPAGPPVDWQFRVTRPGGGNLQKDPVKQVMEIEDIFLVLGYEWQ